MAAADFTATLTAGHDEPYTEATVRGTHTLHSDEPEWLPAGAGDDAHPAPVDYLLTSLASCQVSVLQQCLEAHGVDRYAIECEAEVDEWATADVPDPMPANTAYRVDHVTVRMGLRTTEGHRDEADRCLGVYDDGCIVGQSLAGGIDYTPVAALSVVDEDEL
jgi:uncharacterized OsmC-like protein